MQEANLADVSVLALLLAVLEGGDALAERHSRRRLRGRRPASDLGGGAGEEVEKGRARSWIFLRFLFPS